MRIAALQYANGKVKECDGLNETLHSFFIDFQMKKIGYRSHLRVDCQTDFYP